MQLADKDYFNRFGVNSSDVYYINYDKKQKEIADRKGGARILANDLRAKHSESDVNKRSRMAKEAEERAKVLIQLEQEDLKKTELKKNKKQELRKVMDLDAKNKKDFKERNTQMAQRTSDFGEQNVLSYIYQKKEHQSFKMGQKNDILVNMIKQNFSSQDKLANHEAKTLQRDLDEINRKQDITLKKRMDDRKQKEIEAKLF